MVKVSPSSAGEPDTTTGLEDIGKEDHRGQDYQDNPFPSFRLSNRLSLNSISESVSRSFQVNKKLLAKIDLYATAGLSMCDMLSDIIMIGRYAERGKFNYVLATAICVGLNLLTQSIMVFSTNRSETWLHQIKEQLYVFTLLKPGVDVYRVTTDSTDKISSISARSEMTAARASEMFFEGLPLTVIQLAAMLEVDADLSFTPLASLSLSLSACAFMSAQMSLDWDLSDRQRSYEPAFYGYVPATLGGIFKVASLLFFMSLFNLMTRSLTCVILARNGGPRMLFIVYGSELGIYFIYKAVRGDLWYWPVFYGPAGWSISFFVPVVIKTLVDWTSCVQFRHACEVGGLYFTASIILTAAMSLVAAWTYAEPATLYVVAFSAFGTLTSYAFFLRTIERRYVSTFFDARTGDAYIQQERWSNQESDEYKIRIFTDNEKKWRYAIGDEVSAWVTEKMPAWMEEQPEWLEKAVGMVPEWAMDGAGGDLGKETTATAVATAANQVGAKGTEIIRD
mmetsp:Transcript_24058/g.50003  ORF Transcript_24058/g.50003 Transcript_24058/m.50003 type:complete len:508 (-) Transcript_24058:50-1573(-)